MDTVYTQAEAKTFYNKKNTCTIYKKNINGENHYTIGNPSPDLAQLTLDNFCLSWSATGEAILLLGNIGALQVGHVYPAGAVLGGNCIAYWLIHSKWNTSEKCFFCCCFKGT